VLEQDREKLQRERARTEGAFGELAQLLSLSKLERIEAFDISNISGFDSVGSMVVYENGKQKRNDYRKFRIKTVQGPDDYASMREVLTRRFTHGQRETAELEEQGLDRSLGSFTRYPELIMMDGGKGQVNIAQQVLEELKIPIAVCGMVKDDNHRTRGLYFQGNELPIDLHSECFRLITRIQDETHRFAIEYHKALRGKHQVHSVLDDIKGIGDTRRRALMKYYVSLEAVKAATVEELCGVPSMDHRAAEQVYEFFHTEKNETEDENVHNISSITGE
jgi:excinuclease ABC subunit C